MNCSQVKAIAKVYIVIVKYYSDVVIGKLLVNNTPCMFILVCLVHMICYNHDTYMYVRRGDCCIFCTEQQEENVRLTSSVPGAHQPDSWQLHHLQRCVAHYVVLYV